MIAEFGELYMEIGDESQLEEGRGCEGGGAGRTFGRVLREVEFPSGRVSLGVWKAESGTYSHPGAPGGESFIVIDGDAEITIEGGGVFPLSAGTLITIPPSTPSAITVRETLLKMAVTTAQ